MNTSLRFFLFLNLCFVSLATAAPLGTIPTVEDLRTKILLDFRSDAWTSPYRDKSAPIRIIGGDLRVPLIQGENWKASLEASDEGLSLGRTTLKLGDRYFFLGNLLRSQSLGIGAKRDFNNGSSVSFFASYASASDVPYGEAENTWIEGNLLYVSEFQGANRWVVLVNQSHNRGYLNKKPFPYIGRMYQPSTSFSVMYGFPFLHITWNEPDHWKKEIRLTPVGLTLNMEKILEDGYRVGASASFNIRSYLHEERPKGEDRLYYQEALLEGSLAKRLSPDTALLLGVGYSFERNLYESKNIYRPESDRIRMDNDLFGRLRVEFRL